MNARRNKLAQWIAMQSRASAPTADHAIAELDTYPLREPVSRRAYTLVRLRTKSGITGWGETGRVTLEQLAKARTGIIGKPATAFAVSAPGTTLDPGIVMAMLDITAKISSAPVYRLLGGPTRFKARVMAALHGSSDAELGAALETGMKDGYRAFEIPLPAATSLSTRNQGQAFDLAIRKRMEALHRAAPANVDFVLRGEGSLLASDAARVAATLEDLHLLWFDEPCAVTNLRTIRKITDESVTPLAFGREIREPSVYQDLLREGLVDLLRPSLQHSSLTEIRQIAVLAETYYVAVAPNHDGGPVATAAALHLAASLPNFFAQSIPRPNDPRDRQMRTEILKQPVEMIKDGFATLPSAPGLGVEVNESMLDKYKEAAA